MAAILMRRETGNLGRKSLNVAPTGPEGDRKPSKAARAGKAINTSSSFPALHFPDVTPPQKEFLNETNKKHFPKCLPNLRENGTIFDFNASRCRPRRICCNNILSVHSAVQLRARGLRYFPPNGRVCQPRPVPPPFLSFTPSMYAKPNFLSTSTCGAWAARGRSKSKPSAYLEE